MRDMRCDRCGEPFCNYNCVFCSQGIPVMTQPTKDEKTHLTIKEILSNFDCSRLVLELRTIESFTMIDIECGLEHVNPALLEREVLGFDCRPINGIMHILIYS